MKQTSRKPKAQTKFIRVLDGWESVKSDVGFMHGVRYEYEFIVSPTKRVYRRAYGWELPSLVIDANILPAEHHIRLLRITSKKLCIQIKKELRRKLKLRDG